MSNVVLAQKHNSTQMDKLKLSAAGDLKVHIQDGLIGAADNDLSDQATKLQVFPYLEKPDGSLTVAKCDADGNLKAELTSSIDVAIGDVDMIANTNGDGSGTKKHTLCDSSGRLQVSVLGNEEPDGSGAARHLHLDGNGNLSTTVVNTLNVTPADSANSEVTDDPSKSMCVTLKGRTAINDKTAGKHIKITPNGRLEPVLHARTNISDSATETAVLCDAAGHLQVDIPATVGIKLEDLSSTIDADHVNNSRSLPMTLKARQTIGDHTTGTYIHTDSSGFLSVRDKNLTVIAPNLNTADDTQLPRNYIVLHDQTNNLMKSAKCDTSANLLVASSQLPTSLGQKANSNCLATCRSSTVGAYDLSGRTTLGTASTSTKLLCDSDGFLRVSSETRNEGITTRIGTTVLEANTGTGTNASVSIDLGVAHKMNVIKFYLTAPTGGLDLLVRVSADGTNWLVASGIVFQSTAISGGATVHHSDPRVVNPPRYVQIYNNNNSSTFTLSEVIVVQSSSA